MEVHVDTLGAALLSAAGSLLAASVPAAAYVWRKLPPRRQSNHADGTAIAVLRTDVAYLQADIAEIKSDVKDIQRRMRT